MNEPFDPEAEIKTGGAGFWVGAVVGVLIMAFGLKGLLEAAPATRPSEVGFSLLGLDLVHDAVVAPIVCLIGVLLTRFLPRPIRAPVRAGLFASAMVIIVGWAALRGYGHDQVPDNPTVDPLHYGTAVLTVLAVVWTPVGIWAICTLVGRAHERSGRPQAPPRGLVMYQSEKGCLSLTDLS